MTIENTVVMIQWAHEPLEDVSATHHLVNVSHKGNQVCKALRKSSGSPCDHPISAICCALMHMLECSAGAS